MHPIKWPFKKISKYYHFRLYIAGQSPNSLKAIHNLKTFCESNFKKYDIEIIDLYREPGRAADDNIIALPTLVKVSPSPIIHLIGNLSNELLLKKNLNLGVD